jgi:protein required for attachment to host cells
MRVRIVVADQSEARFYDMEGHTAEPRAAGGLSDPLAHLHDREFNSDRPGRKSDRAPLKAGRRGATGHHGVGSERKPRRREAALFAHKITDEVAAAQRADQFDRLVLMAPPAFLGLLRKALPAALRETISAEIAKDLVHEPPSTVRAYVPAETFGMPARR